MYGTRKNRQAFNMVMVCLIMVCLIAGGCVWAVYAFTKVFSPPPSGPVPAALAGPGRIMSTVDLQRALNRLYPELKLKEDGVYGPLTKAAHERACGDQYARATWPSELVVREAE